jgi:uncharacterized repeat protein (TIGR01451 family)
MLRLFARVIVALSCACLALLFTVSIIAITQARSIEGQSLNSAAVPAAVVAVPPFTITEQSVIPSGLSMPVHIANAHDGSRRLFVVEQGGLVRVIRNGVLLDSPFITLTSKVVCCGEQGLLSIAFDPDYAANGTFYVDYTNNVGDTNVERYVVSNPAADVANVIAATKIITIDQPEANHNGGQLQFGPDGYLYIGMGDGGGGGDQHGPIGNGQNPAVLLGKILRLNVRGVPTYSIPSSNPFTQTASYQPEIWALGLRNPWRFSFDRLNGDLYIGDVGQNCWEEIDYQPGTSHGGENYGWRIMEGYHPFNVSNFNDCTQPPINPPTLTLPIAAYDHGLGSAVAGGYVYRGQDYPWMRGSYFYGDPYSNRLWTIERLGPNTWLNIDRGTYPAGVTSFGEDENGELYVTDYGGGGIWKIVSASPINFSASTKQVSASHAPPGDTLTYTIVLRNTGAPFSNTIRVTDTIPVGLDYLPGSFTATHGAVDASAAPTLKWSGVMSNTSIVTLTYAVTVATSSQITLTNLATIDPAIDFPITRSASVAIENPAPNLSTSTKQASTSVAIFGGTITYSIVLRNTGVPFSNTMSVTDVVPAGLSFIPGSFSATRGVVDASAVPTLKWTGDMSGTSALTMTYAVTVATKIGQSIVNTAVIDPVVIPQLTRSASVTILNAPPDLSPTTKHASIANAIFGDTVTYTIVLRNTGGPFTNTVRVTDTIPAGLSYVPGSFTATKGTIDASAAPTLKWNGVMSNTPAITLTYAVTVSTLTGQLVTNTAAINAAVLPVFNRSAAITISNAPPDLSTSTKQAAPALARFGETISYTILLRNTGGPATNTVRVTDTVPSALGYVTGSLAATSGSVDASSAPTLKWTGVISSSSIVSVTFAVTVVTTNTGVITNTADIDPGVGAPFTRTAAAFLNPSRTYLPLILENF